MKKYLLHSLLSVIFSCSSTVLLQAQNLVLNPSFENTSSCPQGISEFYLCTNWTSTNTGADTCSSPDLYAACAPSFGGVNVPNALLGYHTARTGTHFAGIILGDGLPGCIPTGDNYREYIEGTLSAPLVAGQKYLVIFYASLAEDIMWGSNSLGVYFSNTQYLHDACPNNAIIPETPQLEMCGPAIMDTVNWIPVEWIYTAAGGEQYFTIGNFNNDANTNHVTHNCGTFNPYIYYYIDDVSISPVGPNVCAFAVLTDSANATCGASNGKVAVTALGCPSPFTYAWSNSATTATVSNVPQGSYTVTVTDQTNCHVTASVSVNSNPMTVSMSATNPGCNSSTGSASVSATSGTGPFTYVWSNGSTAQSITDLQAGSYYVTVTGAPGCVAHDSVSLLGSSGMAITPLTTGASCGTSNGSATVNVSGGTPPYHYNWSNGDTAQTATGLAPGTYTVTVAGDTASATFFTENFTNGGTGWTLNTAGTGPNGDSHNQWIVNTDANCTCGSGNYLHITVNSTNSGCLNCLLMAGQCTYLEVASIFGQGDFSTDELAISPVISTVGKSNISLTFNCMADGTPGSDYGLVDFSNDGGNTWSAQPVQFVDSFNCTLVSVPVPINYQNNANFRFAFEWVNGAGSLGGNAGNPPGFVIDNVSLTAASSTCPAITTVTIPSIDSITASVSQVEPACGQNNGSVTATETGTGPFTYLWNNGATSQSVTGLGAGLYIVTVSSSGGCTATASASLSVGSGNISSIASGTNATCGNNNGTITVTVSPSGANYTYLWSNGLTTASINNLGAGTYNVTVSLSGGCSATASSTIISTPGISASASGTRAGCTNSGTGVVTVNTGTAPYTYLWSNGDTAANVTGLAAGNYTITITDAAGCSATATATVISTGTGVTLNAVPTNSGCSSNTGAIGISISTGTTPFSYAWSNGATTDSVSGLAPGTYTVTVTGHDGCTASASATVSASGALTVNAAETGTVCGGNSGSARVTPVGNGPFTYTWSNGATTDSITNVAAGTYTVTVLGTGSCSATAAEVVGTSGTAVNIHASENSICQGDTSQICAPAGYQSYHWSNGDNGQCINATASGNYYVTVTGTGNCTASSNTIFLTVNTPVPVTVTVHGDTLKASSAVSYQWYLAGNAIPGAASSIYVATQDGSYTVKGTDGNGCTATSNTEVIKVLGIAQTGTDENIKVYPNPLQGGSWHIDVSAEWAGSNCELIDATGRVIYRTRLKAEQNEVEMNVAQGVYLVRIISGEKNYTVKLIKL